MYACMLSKHLPMRDVSIEEIILSTVVNVAMNLMAVSVANA